MRKSLLVLKLVPHCSTVVLMTKNMCISVALSGAGDFIVHLALLCKSRSVN